MPAKKFRFTIPKARLTPRLFAGNEAYKADAFDEIGTSTLRHPGLDPGSSAIKSLIAKECFHGADAPWLDAGSSPA